MPYLALTYGPRVGIVTVADTSWSEFERTLVQNYGLSDRLVSIRRIDIDSMSAFTSGFLEPEPVAAEIHAKAKLAVEDGADSVVIASAGRSTIATMCGLAEVEGAAAPIFDCLTVGVKRAELRASLRIGLGVPRSAGRRPLPQGGRRAPLQALPAERPGSRLNAVIPLLQRLRLNEVELELKELTCDFMTRKVEPMTEELENHPMEHLAGLFKAMGGLGILGPFFPEAYGGLDARLRTAAVVAEEAARVKAGLDASMFADIILCARAIDNHGSEERRTGKA